MALIKTLFLFLLIHLTSCSSAFEAQFVDSGGPGGDGEVEVLDPQPVTGGFLTYDNAEIDCKYWWDTLRKKNLTCDIYGRDKNGNKLPAQDFSDGSTIDWSGITFNGDPLAQCSVASSVLSKTWCFDTDIEEFEQTIAILNPEMGERTMTAQVQSTPAPPEPVPAPDLRDLNLGPYGFLTTNMFPPILIPNDNPDAPVTGCESNLTLPSGFDLRAENGSCKIIGRPDKNSVSVGETSYVIRAISNESLTTTSSLIIRIEEEGFISRWRTVLPGESITLDICTVPADNVTIMWGDGSYGDCSSNQAVTKTYNSPGLYTVVVYGLTDPQWNTTDTHNLEELVQWRNESN